jgi:hypothetical protein
MPPPSVNPAAAGPRAEGSEARVDFDLGTAFDVPAFLRRQEG